MQVVIIIMYDDGDDFFNVNDEIYNSFSQVKRKLQMKYFNLNMNEIVNKCMLLKVVEIYYFSNNFQKISKTIFSLIFSFKTNCNLKNENKLLEHVFLI